MLEQHGVDHVHVLLSSGRSEFSIRSNTKSKRRQEHHSNVERVSKKNPGTHRQWNAPGS